MRILVFLIALGGVALAARARADDAGAPQPATQLITGVVRDAEERPVRQVVVFAADAKSDAVVAVAVADAAGEVRFTLPARRHNFGVISPRLGVVRLTPRGGAGFELVVGELPADPAPVPGPPVATLESARAFVVRGRVLDEAGVGLEGVRLVAAGPSGNPVATSFSGARGVFAVVAPGGASVLRASAPGMKSVRSVRQRGQLVVVMAVSGEVERLALHAGRELVFRPSDSIDPEYTPPATVRAWLQFAYGICPPNGPLKAREKRGLKKYWYLEVLRQTPPNPASISTVECASPAAYRPAEGANPQTVLGGFDIWLEPAGP